MSLALEFLGISPAGLNGIPALDPAKAEAAEQAGKLALDLVRGDVRPSTILTRASIENAIAAVAASGGSTNAVLHLLAIARELDLPLEIDDFDEIASRTPVLADLKPAAGSGEGRAPHFLTTPPPTPPPTPTRPIPKARRCS